MNPLTLTLILTGGSGLYLLAATGARRRALASAGRSGGALLSRTRHGVTSLRTRLHPPDPQADRWPELLQHMAALLAAGTDPHRMWTTLAEHSVRDTAPGPHAGRDAAVLVQAAAERAHLGLDPLPAVRETPLDLDLSRQARANLSTAWALSQRTGAPLSDVLRRMAEATEADQDAQAARDTALAGPRATGRILASLPLLGLGLGVVMGTDPLGVLTQQLWGHLALGCGVGLAVAGVLWTRKLIRLAEAGLR